MAHDNNHETALKTWGTIGLGVIIFALIYNLLLGNQMGYGGMMGNGGINLGVSGLLASILVLAIKVLWLVLVISLIAGIVIAARKHIFNDKRINLPQLDKVFAMGYTCPNCGTGLKGDYKFCPHCAAALKVTCSQCGTEAQAGWKHCSTCGAEVQK